ncbi:MAG: exo-alpha-sialidase [Clostridia bacterium]|nr:exo-alpha-sialidase [Clostridia bacterium]
MKITATPPKVICSNPDNPLYNYFGWPSVARLQDGRLMMVASGFRMKHLCPFGKVVACCSTDDGETWTRPAVLLDTPLDDRDAGVVPFGENSVLITSFNNTVQAQRGWNAAASDPYITAYLDGVEASGLEEKYIGSTFIISRDGGKTFGEVMRMPVTTPHGPAPMPDGSLLYAGRTFSRHNAVMADDHIAVYRLSADGTYEKLGDIENVAPGLLSCEPNAIVLPDGKIIVHIRVHKGGYFTLFQSESYDGGHTFTKPRQLLGDQGGAPAHLLRLRNGTLISTYGYREAPFGIRMMYSTDNGDTWSTDHVLWDKGLGNDLGYPCSVELENGEILTVFYARVEADGPAVILETKWTMSE